MSKQYFKGCINPDAVRARYVELVKIGDDLEVINQQLQAKLKQMDGNRFTGKKRGGETYQFIFKLNQEQEERFKTAINKIVELQMPNVEICLLGSWLWIQGETKKYKDQLKELGCRFNSRRTKELGKGVWNWTLTKPRRKFNSKLSRQELGQKYHEQQIAYS